MKIPLSSPWITDEDRQAVLDVLNSQHIALGPKLNEFEERCASLAGVSHAVATSSGTAALSALGTALGWGPGDEVITPSFSFVASANTILHAGARPVFADIDEETWNLDPEAAKAKITAQTRGIQVVDVFGLACDGQALEEICQQHALDLVEDACEAVGARHKNGKPCGSLGRAGTWAFYPNKQVTTGEGGVLLTDDKSLADDVRSLSNQGRGSDGWFDNVRLGWNYRMSDLNAALGWSQLNRLEIILEKRQQVADWYNQEFAECSDIDVMNDEGRSWFVYIVTVENQKTRDTLMNYLNDHGIQSSHYFVPIHLMPHIKDLCGTREGELPHTENLAKRTLALPFFSQMSQEQVKIVARTVRDFFGL